MATAKLLDIRLFLEGIEVPCQGVQVSCGVNQPSQAAIQVVPTDDIYGLLPRTLVHVFYYDDFSNYQPSTMENPTGGRDDPRSWLLLFAGEFLGFGFQKSAGERSIVLQCTDFSSYWDAAKLYFRNSASISSETSKAAAFVGATTRNYDRDDGQSAAGALYSLLRGAPACLPGLKGLLGGMIHMLESIGGVHKGGKKSRGINDFFSQAELRLKLAQMLGASAKDTSSIALFKASEFRKWLKQALGKQNSLISFRQVLELLLARVYHQYTSVPTAYLRPPFDTYVTTYKKKKGKSTLPPELLADAEAQQALIDSQIEAIEQGGLTAEEHDAVVSEQFLGSNDEGASALEGKVEGNDYSGTKHEKAVEDLRKAAVDYQIYVQKANDAVGYGLGDSAVGDNVDTDAAKKQLQKAKESINAAITGRNLYGKGKLKVRIFERLNTHVFCPDIWYAPAPLPNVIFPDRYYTFIMERKFMAEVTRLQVTSKKERESQDDILTGEVGRKQRYWAPLVPDVYGKLSKLSAKKGAKFIMPHEIFTGIVPRFDFVPDIAGFRKVDKENKRSKIPYLQRIANFNFFKYRYAARTGTISAPFSPVLIPGHPCVIIDKYRPDALQEELGIEPQQWLGVIHQMVHNINQKGGSTAITVTHLRNHREQAEFLGAGQISVVEKTGTKKKRSRVKAQVIVDPDTGEVIGTATAAAVSAVAGPAAAAAAPAAGLAAGATADQHDQTAVLPDGMEVGSKGPSGGKITEVNIDVAPGAASGAAGTATGTSVAATVGAIAGPAAGVTAGAAAGTAASVVVGDVEVVEEVGIYKTRKINLPLEEVVRPPWVSPIYSNRNIGPDYYREMFGCGSITDPLDVAHPSSVDQGEKTPMEDLDETFQELADSLDSLAEELEAGTSETQSPATSVHSLQGVEATTPNAELDAQKERTVRLAAQIKAGSTITQSVEALVVAYRELRINDYDTNAFIQEITKRPIANLEQVLGSEDLEFNTTTGEVSEGTEGFHSRAFGDYEALQLLEHSASKGPDGEGKLRKVDPKIDPRQRRYEKVEAYADSLRAHRAFLG